jgi:Uma2 family endonuclease
MAVRDTYVTPDEYLAFERQAEYKNEYDDGIIVAMTGASREHNLIAWNYSRRLGNQLEGQPCEAYIADMRVRTALRRQYYYPDVVVVCGQPQLEDKHGDTLLNPTLLIEILSPSTERYDRGRKFRGYQSIESLQEYVLIAQDEYRVERFARQPDGQWLYADFGSLESVVELNSIACLLSLRDIYERVVLER